ncbi:MAG: nitronate monooxygenase family protein [Desulfobacterales bacterium]|nr:nitronate monooxygenase family protein [Desulfobacterales bacterium]
MNFPELNINGLVSRIPVIQGGMGVGISLAGLASAVANEGGIGVIATAMIGISEPDAAADPAGTDIRVLRHELRKARSLTGGIIGLNIMVALTNFAHLVRTGIEEGVDIIFSGAGLPMDLPGYLPRDAKTKLAPIISSARAATLICKRWMAKYNRFPDAFVVEGPKAGGHLGFKEEQLEHPDFALEKLIIEVVAAVKPLAAQKNTTIPIIAAGGIYTGQDIRAIMALGASGVQMGTRFAVTVECDAAQAFKEALLNARQEDLIIIKSPVGMPGRAVRNRFLDEVQKGKKTPINCPYHCVKTCLQAKSPYCIALALVGAKNGKFHNGFAFAGSNAYRVNEILSVKTLIGSLQREFSMACATEEYSAPN